MPKQTLLTLKQTHIPSSLQSSKVTYQPSNMILLLILFAAAGAANAQSSVCRTECGGIPIAYPFGIDDGCGSPRFRNLLFCPSPSTNILRLRTPSGTYPVLRLSYSDPHLVLSDPSMLSCARLAHAPVVGPTTRPPPFSLDTASPLSLSTKNDFLFFNCSPETVIVEPKPALCGRFPDRCASACDSAGYLCRNLPGCPNAMEGTGTTCCSYYPKASESVRMMLRHCGGYASVYWRNVGDNVPVPYDQVPEYGVRVDFDVPVTTRCRQCREKGGGVCGYDTRTRGFLCLCDQRNVTGYCGDGSGKHGASAGVIAGTTTVVSAAGAAGAGALIYFLRKLRSNKVVTCGVQTNENRLF